MKNITLLAALTVLTGTGVAIAQPAAPAAPAPTTSVPTTPAATPASAPATPPTPAATPVQPTSLTVCNKQADGKKLTGADRAQFIKDCRTGKSAS